MANNESEPGKAPMPPRVEHPSTYSVQDRAHLDERAQLITQDHLITLGMGGILPELAESATQFQRVLDVGCGTGGWLINMAREYPAIKLLIGVDISSQLLDYARELATAQEVAKRVEFHIMDALRMLEFPNDFFDLVNMRLGASYLRQWDWPKLLSEFCRVAKPEGIIRVTESDGRVESNSPALTTLFDLFITAFANAGHLFGSGKDASITNELPHLLERAGITAVQTHRYPTSNQAGTPGWPYFVEDMKRVFRTLRPFLRKWIALPDNYDEFYQQMLTEIEQPGFVGNASLLTAWGKAPFNL